MGRRITYLKEILAGVLDLLYYKEESCIICGRGDSNFLCPSCEGFIRKTHDKVVVSINDESFEVYPYAFYGNVIRELMLRLKYKKDYDISKVFAGFLHDKLMEINLKPDVITYIPSRPETLKKRGYNQCQLMGKELSKLTDTDILELLSINDNSKDQIGLSALERFKNLEGKFNAIYYPKLKNKKILLIDDVITTGATVFHGALELKKYYGDNIYILTVAKSRL